MTEISKPSLGPQGRMPKRLVVLFSQLSDYMLSCLGHLRQAKGWEVMVVAWRPSPAAPYDFESFARVGKVLIKQDHSADQLHQAVINFQPDALLLAGWLDQDYLRTAGELRKRGVPVVAGCDTQWRGTFRQRVACVLSPWYLKKRIDVLWVAGDRQRKFARRLGYHGPWCWIGYYSCNWPLFAQSPETLAPPAPTAAFLFAGRYVAEKGITDLLAAYREYRTCVTYPWKLVCAGAGEYGSLLREQEGVQEFGFLQPKDLADLMKCGNHVLVLPSRYEPWGVVIHEAAAAGLALICSDACGAAVHLLQDGFNGYLSERGNVRHLLECLVRMHELPNAARAEMGAKSYDLSQQFTPAHWAETLVAGLAQAAWRDAPALPKH